jgi:MAP/microtubule affinity-regulating kinase
MSAIHNLPTRFGKYKIVRILGEGSTCVVAEAFDRRTGQSYAVKIHGLNDNISLTLSAAIEREIRILKSLDHPNIIKLIDVFRSNGCIFLVLEHCEGGTLLDFILSNKLKDLSEVKRLFRQIVESISYLHRRGISHGDIKPDNIVLTTDGDAKLIDFGYSKESLIGFDEDKSGTVKYSSPELFVSGFYDTQKSDIWSLGIILFVMATGRFPYSSSDDEVVREIIISGCLARSEHIDSDLSELYDILTRFAPMQRPTADVILNFPCLIVDEKKEEQKTEKTEQTEKKNEKKQEKTSNVVNFKMMSANEMEGLTLF